MECMSFGAISRVYKFLKGDVRQEVSKQFNLQHDILQSWIHSLSYTRNVCAHHGRLWKRTFTIQPKIPKQYRPDIHRSQSRTLYMVCCMLNHLMKVIADGSGWSDRLHDLVDDKPKGIELKRMGFPEHWTRSPLWKS